MFLLYNAKLTTLRWIHTFYDNVYLVRKDHKRVKERWGLVDKQEGEGFWEDSSPRKHSHSRKPFDLPSIVLNQ